MKFNRIRNINITNELKQELRYFGDSNLDVSAMSPHGHCPRIGGKNRGKRRYEVGLGKMWTDSIENCGQKWKYFE